MIGIYILMDVLLLALLLLLCLGAAYLWTKKKALHKGPLSQFRNDDIYEKSLQDSKRLAHIEDGICDIDNDDVDTLPDETDKDISFSDIEFCGGYGGREGDEDEN